MASKQTTKPARTVRRIGKGGTIAIPADLRVRLGLEEGARVVLQERDGGLLLLTAAQAEREDEEKKRFWEWAEAEYERLRAGPAPGQSRKAWGREVLAQSNIVWDALMADPESRRQIEEEDALWECTLMDGLDPDEVWEESDFVQQ